MKVLLINPPVKNTIDLEVPAFVRQNEGCFPPLGLMYIAAYLKKHLDCRVDLLDALAEGLNYSNIGEYVRSYKPDIVGITAHTHNLIDVISTAKEIKQIDERIHLCLGGPHVNIFPRESLNIPHVDSVVPGEAEESFTRLVKCIVENKRLDEADGILFKQGKVIVGADRKSNLIDDLDNLPFPDRSLINHKKYSSVLGRRVGMATILSARGCSYACAFCSTPKGPLRMRSPENVVDEMEACVNSGISEIHFVDDTFNADPVRVEKICFEIKKRKLKVRWSFRGRVDKLNGPLFKNVKDAGCYRVHLGVETCSDDGLKRLKKGITVKQISDAFRLARRHKINTVAYFLIGCPHEKNREQVLETIDFSKKIKPDFCLFNILTLYPETELYREALEKGMIAKDLWKDFADCPRKDFQPPCWGEWFSREELVFLLNLAYRRFYLRPTFMLKELSDISEPGRLVRHFKAGLGIIKSSLAKC